MIHAGSGGAELANAIEPTSRSAKAEKYILFARPVITSFFFEAERGSFSIRVKLTNPAAAMMAAIEFERTLKNSSPPSTTNKIEARVSNDRRATSQRTNRFESYSSC